MDNAAFAEQFAARLGTDDAANPSGSQGGSDEALLQIDRKGGVVQFRKRSNELTRWLSDYGFADYAMRREDALLIREAVV